MGNDKDIIGVALTKELCPICLKEMDGGIVMNTRLTAENARKVEELHQKVVGFSVKECPDCLELKEQAFIIIEVDASKTEDKRNPWRTGYIFGIRKEAAARLFTEVPPEGVCFMDYNLTKKHGIHREVEDAG